MLDKITSTYIHKLQGIYHDIDNRGIRADPIRLEAAGIYINSEIQRNLAIAASQWNCHVFIGAANAITDKNNPGYSDQVNLNATQGDKQLLKKLQDLGYKVPKITKKNSDGEYESKYSTCELALQKMLVTNQFNLPGGDPGIRAILQVRELGKIKSTYLGCRYYKSGNGDVFYLSNYNCAGTKTGRRSSRKHTYGFGNNAQNFPKHGKLAKIFRRCLVARPNNIFLMVDQKAAEEWPVNALAQNYSALQELKEGVSRHAVRASKLFNIPLQQPYVQYQGKFKKAHFLEYFLGKKVGHANNYGMRGSRMSDSLAQEGHVITPQACQALLDKANNLEPEIKGVFHKYVQEELNKSRILVSPFGRERQFMGLRPNDSNYSVFNEAYAYIPQSVVGDNTGFAVCYLESVLSVKERNIIQEGHDSIIQDIPAAIDSIWFYLENTIRAFDRPIRFHNGIDINIPIEASLGYNLNSEVEIEELTYDGVAKAFAKINLIRESELEQERKDKLEYDLAQLSGQFV